jgi:hypothetical protein
VGVCKRYDFIGFSGTVPTGPGSPLRCGDAASTGQGDGGESRETEIHARMGFDIHDRE